MRKIKNLIGIPNKYITSLRHYGVEIEVEGENLPTEFQDYWRVEVDHSLKTAEAWEYVLRMPGTLEEVEDALKILDGEFNRRKSVVHDSVRAGVHVHLNVQDWNIKQLMSFSTCYYIVEDLLMKWCGDNREGNLFCLRTKDAEFVLFKILQALEEKNLSHLKSDIIRYSSLNYCSLFRYGTIEFRGMRSTRDLSYIYKWVKIIDELRKSSERFSDPSEIINNFSGSGETQFLKLLLPDSHGDFQYPGYEKTIREAVRRVQMVAFGIDWDSISSRPINIFSTPNGGF